MAPVTVLADAIVALLTAGLFTHVGRLVLHRPVEGKGARIAIKAFAVWWFGLAAFTMLGAARQLLAVAGNLHLGTHVAINTISTIPLVALLWGLVYYLVYIYTANRILLNAVTALHVGILAFYAWIIISLDPVAVTVTDWAVPIEYEGGLDPRLTAAILVTMLAPTLLAAFGYFTLFFRVENRTSRYRIAMTSLAFLFWFGMAGISSVTPLSDWFWWPLLSRIDGLVATLLVLAGYRPPRWVQDRFGIRPIETTPEDAQPAEARLGIPV